MDADLGRTSSGRLCKKCEKKGDKCSQHGGTPSPKLGKKSLKKSLKKLLRKSLKKSPKRRSPKTPSPKRRSPKTPSPKKISGKSTGLEDMPCDVLLKIANNLNPEDYLKLDLVSRSIDLCLSEGRYNTEKDKMDLKRIQKELLVKKQLGLVRADPEAIEKIQNPPEIVQLLAVNTDA